MAVPLSPPPPPALDLNGSTNFVVVKKLKAVPLRTKKNFFLILFFSTALPLKKNFSAASLNKVKKIFNSLPNLSHYIRLTFDPERGSRKFKNRSLIKICTHINLNFTDLNQTTKFIRTQR